MWEEGLCYLKNASEEIWLPFPSFKKCQLCTGVCDNCGQLWAWVLSWWLSGKASACNERDAGSIPGWARSSGGGHGHPLQHSCLENSMDRGAWRATVHGVAKSWTRLKRLIMRARGFFISSRVKLRKKGVHEGNRGRND